MASVHSSLPAISTIRSTLSSSSITTTSLVILTRSPEYDRRTRRQLRCRCMVQQAVQGAPAAYAKEMERLSAKESLLLAFKDSGGFEALVTGKTSDMQRIDVNERITGLERLNPTPRPTTSPFLEGRWNFEWVGSGSPGLSAARFIFERFPSTLANLSKMEVMIKDQKANITANLKLLNSIESKFIVSTKLSIEGPLRMKEEYIEGIIESPTVIEETLPDQLKGALSQAVTTVQQLPVPIRDAVSSGLRVPLNESLIYGCILSSLLLLPPGGSFQRLFMISYLDAEILVIRDTAGIPEVLTRLDSPTSPIADSVTEYES
ncbi:hypothetical protein Ddye_018808 [Dipteronia dyeriana]|uniref:Plastid lipid-associated protein/fibrillin conserved domain-containing protein n=1 Tax=Dipteronia dyeriana TaxID=168575 RepID=A0AAD9UC07_9ROSI|nr:hypothetical protein Ddye_018808 [Dipteronia dyeriana]